MIAVLRGRGCYGSDGREYNCRDAGTLYLYGCGNGGGGKEWGSRCEGSDGYRVWNKGSGLVRWHTGSSIQVRSNRRYCRPDVFLCFVLCRSCRVAHGAWILQCHGKEEFETYKYESMVRLHKLLEEQDSRYSVTEAQSRRQYRWHDSRAAPPERETAKVT